MSWPSSTPGTTTERIVAGTPPWMAALPDFSWRRVPALIVEEHLQAVMDFAGVTRLSDVTGLDRLLLPVAQAVRPMSLALSVHQGKGTDFAAARLSAAMEALESAAAEAVAADGPRCPARALDDAIVVPGCELDAVTPIDWLSATRLDGGSAHVPFDFVTLDFTRPRSAFCRRDSSGLAAGGCIEDATSAALLELAERSAVRRWRAGGRLAMTRAIVDPDSIDCSWWQAFDAHARINGIDVTAYALRGVLDLPVIVVRLDEAGFWTSCWGSACRPNAEAALFDALAEAAQSRLTAISGMRDDIPADALDGTGMLSLAPPTGQSRIDWQRFTASQAKVESPQALGDALLSKGYTRSGYVNLSPAIAGVAVVKAFVPGLD